jgi:hypothetical protein
MSAAPGRIGAENAAKPSFASDCVPFGFVKKSSGCAESETFDGAGVDFRPA